MDNTKRVIVYVDGFNLYFGLKSKGWRKYYWLDFVKFFTQFLKPHQTLEEVNYFSASQRDPGKKKRQDLLFSANKVNPKFHLHLGKYLEKKINFKGQSIVTYEEKETDVRIAVKMIRDIVLDKCDVSILVSADSDLIPAIEFIREFKPNHKIFVYFPPKRFSYDLNKRTDAQILLEHHVVKFNNSVLPEDVQLPSGYIAKKPGRWK